MRLYEVVYIFDPALEESAIEAKIEKFNGLLGGTVHETDVWGVRQLAYPIQKQNQGFYVVVQAEADPESLPEFERLVKLDDDVMRYLVVINEGEPTTGQSLVKERPEGLGEPEEAVGRRLALSFSGQNWSPWARVVGVVADAKEYGMDRTGVHTVYRAADQAVWGPALVIATAGDPGPLARHVRETIHGLQASRPVDQVRTLASLRDRDVAPSRLNATLFGAFAALALVIAAVGVLGVLAFSVSQRVRELGIRMALGADRGRILRAVLGEGVLLVVGALLLGGVGALFLGRFLAGLLFGVEPVDVPTLLGAGGVLGAVALLAAFLPARRATEVDPMRALRTE